MISAVCANLRCWWVLHDRHVSEEAKQLTSLSRTAIDDDFIAGSGYITKIVQLFIFPEQSE